MIPSTGLICPECGNESYFIADNGRVLCDICLSKNIYVIVEEVRKNGNNK